jgi:hypothetical protein
MRHITAAHAGRWQMRGWLLLQLLLLLLLLQLLLLWLLLLLWRGCARPLLQPVPHLIHGALHSSTLGSTLAAVCNGKAWLCKLLLDNQRLHLHSTTQVACLNMHTVM